MRRTPGKGNAAATAQNRIHDPEKIGAYLARRQLPPSAAIPEPVRPRSGIGDDKIDGVAIFKTSSMP